MVRETKERRLKVGWKERVEIVIDGNNQELMESLRNGTRR